MTLVILKREQRPLTESSDGPLDARRLRDVQSRLVPKSSYQKTEEELPVCRGHKGLSPREGQTPLKILPRTRSELPKLTAKVSNDLAKDSVAFLGIGSPLTRDKESTRNNRGYEAVPGHETRGSWTPHS